MTINILVTYSCWQVDETIRFFTYAIFFRLLALSGFLNMILKIPGWNIIYYGPKCGQVGFSGLRIFNWPVTHAKGPGSWPRTMTNVAMGSARLRCRGGSRYVDGSMILWFFGFLVWGFMVLWLYGWLVLGFYGFRVLWLWGFTIVWLYGFTVFMVYGFMVFIDIMVNGYWSMLVNG